MNDVRVSDEVQENRRVPNDISLIVGRSAASQRRGGQFTTTACGWNKPAPEPLNTKLGNYSFVKGPRR